MYNGGTPNGEQIITPDFYSFFFSMRIFLHAAIFSLDSGNGTSLICRIDKKLTSIPHTILHGIGRLPEISQRKNILRRVGCSYLVATHLGRLDTNRILRRIIY